MTAITTALSGMRASMMRLNASASNIANANTTGPVPPTPPSEPVTGSPGRPSVYQPVSTVQSSLADGGVATTYAPVTPSYIQRYDPSLSFANGDGLIAAPNVELTDDLADQVDAALSFKANLAVVQTADEMMRSTLERWA